MPAAAHLVKGGCGEVAEDRLGIPVSVCVLVCVGVCWWLVLSAHRKMKEVACQ